MQGAETRGDEVTPRLFLAKNAQTLENAGDVFRSSQRMARNGQRAGQEEMLGHATPRAICMNIKTKGMGERGSA